MKKLKPRAYLILSLVLVLTVAVVNFLMWPNKKVDIVVNEEVQTSVVHRKVFLISQDNFVIPVTIGFQAKPNLAEELYFVTSLLKEGSPIIQEGMSGIFPQETLVHSISLDQKILTLNVSSQFANYPAKKEIRILESLAWTYGQYKEIEGIRLQVDGVPLTKMPVNKTVIPSPLSKGFGINNHVFFQHYGQKPLTLYYQKTIDGLTYYVPTTRREDIQLTEVSSIVSLIHEDISPVIGLKPLPVWDQLTLNSTPVLADGTLQFDLGVDALVDETSVSKDLYEAIILVFMELDFVEKVSILVTGEEVQVGDYEIPEIIDVADIIVNEVAI